MEKIEKDGKKWENMGKDEEKMEKNGKNWKKWEKIGKKWEKNGKKWEKMGKDGKRWEEDTSTRQILVGLSISLIPNQTCQILLKNVGSSWC